MVLGLFYGVISSCLLFYFFIIFGQAYIYLYIYILNHFIEVPGFANQTIYDYIIRTPQPSPENALGRGPQTF